MPWKKEQLKEKVAKYRAQFCGVKALHSVTSLQGKATVNPTPSPTTTTAKKKRSHYIVGDLVNLCQECMTPKENYTWS